MWLLTDWSNYHHHPGPLNFHPIEYNSLWIEFVVELIIIKRKCHLSCSCVCRLGRYHDMTLRPIGFGWYQSQNIQWFLWRRLVTIHLLNHQKHPLMQEMVHYGYWLNFFSLFFFLVLGLGGEVLFLGWVGPVGGLAGSKLEKFWILIEYAKVVHFWSSKPWWMRTVIIQLIYRISGRHGIWILMWFHLFYVLTAWCPDLGLITV